MIKVTDSGRIRSKCKAIGVLFPYAVRRERHGDYMMLDALLCATRVSQGPMWARVKPFISNLFNEASPWAIVLVSPHMDWDWRNLEDNRNLISHLAAAAAAVPYIEENCQNVVEALLDIASTSTLRPHIPISIWAWLKKRLVLPPSCLGRLSGTEQGVVHQVQAFGDTELLKSYLLLVWSEWDHIIGKFGAPTEMRISIREVFGGIGMGHHWKDLVERLDHVLGQLDQGLGYLKQHKPSLGKTHIQVAKEQYGELKRMLLDMDGEAVNILARTPPRLVLFSLLTLTDTHRISFDLHVRPASPASMTLYLENLAVLPLAGHFICTLAPVVVVALACPLFVALVELHLPRYTYPCQGRPQRSL